MDRKKIESVQDYLERILMLEKELGLVKSVDIARSFNYSKPSISIAMKKLKEGNLINIDDKGHISLTEKGKEIALKVYDRHTTLSKLFIKLGVPEEIAIEDACKIEHDISDVTYEAIKKHIADKIDN